MESVPQQTSEHLEKIEKTYEFQIPAKQKPERLDAFLTHAVENATRTKVQKGIESGNVLVNGQTSRANYKIKPLDVITCTVMRMPPIQLIPEDIPLDIRYEDDDLVVIEKPAGISVHPGIGHRSGTIVNAMLYHMGVREAIDVATDIEPWDEEDEGSIEPTDANIFASAEVRPGIVHRLDKDTTGLLVVAKHYAASMNLATQFKDRTVNREYVALVWGVMRDDHGLVEGQIGYNSRNRKLRAVVDKGGKDAATEYTVLERYECATLVRLKLRTGRTHQIRVHMAHLHHPVVGDKDYGGRESAIQGVYHAYRKLAKDMLAFLDRQALHARTLGFVHPITKKVIDVQSEVPHDMQSAITLCRTSALS